MSHPYVDGITDTVPHDITTSLTTAQITADQDTLSMSVVCPEITIKLPGS